MFQIRDFASYVDQEKLDVYGVIVGRKEERLDSFFRRMDHRFDMHSLSKGFMTMAVGMLIEEGLLKPEDRVISFFPEKLDVEPGEYLASMTVEHLLTMSSGHEKPLLMDTTRDSLEDLDWVHYFLNYPLVRRPGTKFVYDTGCTYLLSAICLKLTGETVLDYLKPRLFEPLNIRNPQWLTCPKGIPVGGAGLLLNTEEVARFCELLLNRGEYRGRRLGSAGWIDAVSAKHIESEPVRGETVDGTFGYGYQFWRCSWPNAYRAYGSYGQYAIILPDQGAYVAITAREEKNVQKILDGVWAWIAPQL